MAEMVGLSLSPKPADAILAIWDSLIVKGGGMQGHFPRPPFVIISGVTKGRDIDFSLRTDDYAQLFANYIRAHGLGEMIRSGERMNHTGNHLVIWIWSPRYEELIIWKNRMDTGVEPTPKVMDMNLLGPAPKDKLVITPEKPLEL